MRLLALIFLILTTVAWAALAMIVLLDPDEYYFIPFVITGKHQHHVFFRFHGTSDALRISFSSALIGAFVCPMIAVRCWSRRSWYQRLDGICPLCTYDLRKTPLRCPECGYKPLILRRLTEDELKT